MDTILVGKALGTKMDLWDTIKLSHASAVVTSHIYGTYIDGFRGQTGRTNTH